MTNDLDWLKLNHLNRVEAIRRRAASREECERELDRRLDDEQDVLLPGDLDADDDEDGGQEAFLPLEPDQVLEKLRSADPDEQEEALVHLLREEEVPVTPALVAALTPLLAGDDDVLRDLAASVVGKAGRPMLTPEIVTAIIRILDNHDGMSWVQGTVLVCRLGVDSPEVRLKLAHLARDMDPYARAGATQALGELGAREMTPEIATTLARSLGDVDRDVRLAGAHAVTKIGAAAGAPDVFLGLGQLLNDEEDDELRASAFQAIESLGPEAVVAELSLIDKMLMHLNDRLTPVRKFVGRFIANVPAAAERLRIAASEILAMQPEAASPRIIGLASGFSPAWSSPGPGLCAASGGGFGPAVAEPSGTLADGRITFKADRDLNGVNFRFGSRDLDLEYSVLTIDAVPASDPKTESSARTPATRPHVSILVLQKIGRYQVGGRIQIPSSEWPQPAPLGVIFTPRVVSL